MLNADKFEFLSLRLTDALADELTEILLSRGIRERLNRALSPDGVLDSGMCIGLLSEYLYFARNAEENIDQKIRERRKRAEELLVDLEKHTRDLLQCLRSLERMGGSEFEKALFDPSRIFAVGIANVRTTYEKTLSDCKAAIENLRIIPKPKGRPVNALQRFFIRQAILIWVFSTGKRPGITVEGPFSQFVSLLVDLLPSNGRPKSISQDGLATALSDLKKEVKGAIEKKNLQLPP